MHIINWRKSYIISTLLAVFLVVLGSKVNTASAAIIEEKTCSSMTDGVFILANKVGADSEITPDASPKNMPIITSPHNVYRIQFLTVDTPQNKGEEKCQLKKNMIFSIYSTESNKKYGDVVQSLGNNTSIQVGGQASTHNPYKEIALTDSNIRLLNNLIMQAKNSSGKYKEVLYFGDKPAATPDQILKSDQVDSYYGHGSNRASSPSVKQDSKTNHEKTTLKSVKTGSNMKSYTMIATLFVVAGIGLLFASKRLSVKK